MDREAVERVARAMCIDGGFNPADMMSNGGPRWLYYEPQARAAIAEVMAILGEPTEAMLRAGRDVDSETGWSDNPKNIWRAALSASPLSQGGQT